MTLFTGIESIVIDAELSKVSVVGTVPASTLVKKLGKAGKFAAPWSPIPASSFVSASNRDQKKDHFPNITNINKVSAKQLLDYDTIAMPKMSSTHENIPRISNFANNLNEQNKYLNYMLGSDLNDLNNSTTINSNKKVKGGKRVPFGGASGVGVGGPLFLSHHVHNNDLFMNTNNTNHAMVSSKIMSISGYRNSMESVEFATSMFSDENANNCSIM